jgi:hypothetical protein
MTISNELKQWLGVSCQPLSDCVAMIVTALTFEDGENIPLFAERTGSQIRFFDDGGVLFHFLGRGLFLGDKHNNLIHTIAENHGLLLNPDGEFEIVASKETASAELSRYLSAMIGMMDWERDHSHAASDNGAWMA